MINDYIYSYILSKNYTNKVAETKADLVDGKVPSSQLPSYVDDVLEYSDLAHFPEEGEAGKIYVAQDTGYTYRWSGNVYVQIGGQDLSDYATKDYVSTAIDNAKELPATLGTAGQVLTVNSNADGVEWANASGDGKLYAHNIRITLAEQYGVWIVLEILKYSKSNEQLNTIAKIYDVDHNQYINAVVRDNTNQYNFWLARPVYLWRVGDNTMLSDLLVVGYLKNDENKALVEFSTTTISTITDTVVELN